MSRQFSPTLSDFEDKLELLKYSFMETGPSHFADSNTERLYQKISRLSPLLSDNEIIQGKEAQTITTLNSHFNKEKDQYIRTKINNNCFVFRGISLEKSTQKSNRIQKIKDRSFTIIKTKTDRLQPISEQQMKKKLKNNQRVEIVYNYKKGYCQPQEIQIITSRYKKNDQKLICLPSTNKKSYISQEANTPRGQPELQLGKGRKYTFKNMSKRTGINMVTQAKQNLFNCLDITFNTQEKLWETCLCGENQIIASKIRQRKWE